MYTRPPADLPNADADLTERQDHAGQLKLFEATILAVRFHPLISAGALLL